MQVGSGTDPAEGAALAGVLLDRLADTACLTYATTHHAQLKDRPVSLLPIECAKMSLFPTCWHWICAQAFLNFFSIEIRISGPVGLEQPFDKTGLTPT